MGQKIVRILAIGALVGAVAAPAGAFGSPATQPATGTRSAWDHAVAAAPRVASTPRLAAPTPSVAGGVVPAAGPVISVTPDTGLVRGQSVTVTGSGLGADNLALVECPAGVTPAFSCDLGSLTITTPDATGAPSPSTG